MRLPVHLTYELGRFATLEGAPLAVRCALGEVETGRVDVVFVWQAAVHRLARHLFVPLSICAGYSDQRVRLETRDKSRGS